MASILDSVNQRTQLVGQNRLELLLFRLNGRQRFGINVFKVREVLQCPPLTVMPKLNSCIRGVAHIRGQTISVIDLSMAMGKRPIQDISKCFIIINHNAPDGNETVRIRETLPLQFLAVQLHGLVYEVPGRGRFAGLEVTYPRAIDIWYGI